MKFIYTFFHLEEKDDRFYKCYRLFINININEIDAFINNIESISHIRKEFYKKIIEKRYTIIKKTYESI